RGPVRSDAARSVLAAGDTHDYWRHNRWLLRRLLRAQDQTGVRARHRHRDRLRLGHLLLRQADLGLAVQHSALSSQHSQMRGRIEGRLTAAIYGCTVQQLNWRTYHHGHRRRKNEISDRDSAARPRASQGGDRRPSGSERGEWENHLYAEEPYRPAFGRRSRGRKTGQNPWPLR